MEQVKVKKVFPAPGGGFAVLLGNEKKTFPMYVGDSEGTALRREIAEQAAARPLTHDLIGLLISGFDLEIKSILISNLVENTFFATLVLEQRIVGNDGEWTGRRNEVRIDARPSDCLVLAMKMNKEILVADTVFQRVGCIDGLFGAMIDETSTGGTAPFELEDDVDFDLDMGDFEGDPEH